MPFGELLLIAVGLAADAFAVSLCKGTALTKSALRPMMLCGLWFGIFQGGMTFLGYLPGSRFQTKLLAVDHWVAFSLLALIGIGMIRGAVKEGGGDMPKDKGFGIVAMFFLALATSVDAMAMGVTFGVLQTDIVTACAVIALITASLSALGVKLGSIFGILWQSKARLCGGIILILMGTKLLLTHIT